MTGLQTFRDLDAWKVGMTIVELTYAMAKSLPPDERFELAAQMRKAAMSIPSNIAEGFGRGRARMCAHFVRIAIGSNAELETQLEAARRLNFVSSAAAQPLQDALNRERQILHGLLRNRERQIALPAGCLALWLTLTAARLLA